MNKESAEHGPDARNTLQLRLLENRDVDDALSGLKFLRRCLTWMPGTSPWSAIRSEDRSRCY
jgi:hypothetical protein